MPEEPIATRGRPASIVSRVDPCQPRRTVNTAKPSPRTQAIAERAGKQVELRIATGEFEAAKAAIDAAQRDIAEELDPVEYENLTLAEIGIDVRTTNTIERYLGITTVGPLLQLDETKLLALPNIGAKALEQIRLRLRLYRC